MAGARRCSSPLAWAIIHSEAGKLKMPPTGKLAADAKRDLQLRLRDEFGLTFDKVSRLVGVSKQSVIATTKRAAAKRNDGKATKHG
jgi:hypothetical protein